MTNSLFIEEDEKVNGKNQNTGLTVFENNDFGKIRTVIKNNQPYFVAKDVCDVLDIVNHKDAIATLIRNYDAIGIDAKGVVNSYPLQTAGGVQKMTIINETGLYDLIAQSRKPNALKFKYWVHSEFFPATRKALY
jgi:prophage antirepressor-like protein